MKCKKCHHNLAEDAKFCKECGAEVKEQENQCEKCNHELTKDDKFCAKCGEKVHKEEYVQGTEKEQTESSPSVSTKKGKNKSVILAIAGVVVLAIIVLLVFNMKDSNKDPMDDYSLDELAEHYGIEEDLLTYEEMVEAVEKIEEDYEEIKELSSNTEVIEFIEEVIEKDYGELNAIAYREGYLIKEDMTASDKQQVIASLLGYPTFKEIRNPLEEVYTYDEVNENITLYDLVRSNSTLSFALDEDGEEEIKMVGDTEGYYNLQGIKLGYPVMGLNTLTEDQIYNNDSEKEVVYVEFIGLLNEDVTPEELYEVMINSSEVEVNGSQAREYIPFLEEFEEDGLDFFIEDLEDIKKIPKNTYVLLFGVYLPLEDVVEGYEGDGGSNSDLYERIEQGELGVPKINLEGIEIEFKILDEDSRINPEVIN